MLTQKLDAQWFFSRCRRFMMPEKGGLSGAAAVSEPTTPSKQESSQESAKPAFEDLSYFDGGELLEGATRNGEPELKGDLPDEWTPENAAGEEDEEAGQKSGSQETRKEEGEEKKGADEKGEAETETDKETETDPESVEAKGWPESARKRVDKLTAQRTAVEKERDEAKAKVTELEARVASNAVGARPVSTPENPLAHIDDEAGLIDQRDFAQFAKDWAFDHLTDGGEVPNEIAAVLTGKKASEITEPMTLDVAATRQLYKNAERIIQQHIPARARAIKVEREAMGWLKENAPDYLDASKPEGKLFNDFVGQFPAIKQLAHWPTLIASAVRGHRLFEAERQAAADKAAGKVTEPKPEPAKVPPSPGNPRGGAKPAVVRPKPAVKELSASMDAEELAATM